MQCLQVLRLFVEVVADQNLTDVRLARAQTGGGEYVECSGVITFL